MALPFLNKTALYRELAEESGETQRACEAVVQAMMMVAAREVGKGHKFVLPKFFKIEPRYRKALPRRQAKVPKTGELAWFDAKPASIVVKGALFPTFAKPAAPAVNSKVGRALKK